MQTINLHSGRQEDSFQRRQNHLPNCKSNWTERKNSSLIKNQSIRTIYIINSRLLARREGLRKFVHIYIYIRCRFHEKREVQQRKCALHTLQSEFLSPLQGFFPTRALFYISAGIKPRTKGLINGRCVEQCRDLARFLRRKIIPTDYLVLIGFFFFSWGSIFFVGFNENL